jgi:hypothetical protein
MNTTVFVHATKAGSLYSTPANYTWKEKTMNKMLKIAISADEEIPDKEILEFLKDAVHTENVLRRDCIRVKLYLIPAKAGEKCLHCDHFGSGYKYCPFCGRKISPIETGKEDNNGNSQG